MLTGYLDLHFYELPIFLLAFFLIALEEIFIHSVTLESYLTSQLPLVKQRYYRLGTIGS